ncbi:hypothetical protein [Flaviaesturariibacter amylovorans]|uniref:Scramblase n=1 Tax=Flaviaesturariibacter amylovorans TaxID=1084520 RepID=A0ABP8HMY9_9BACT
MVAEARTEHVQRPEPFFGRSEFYVEERRGSVKRHNEFAIYDGTGSRIGVLLQPVSVAMHFWRIFLRSSLLPFRFVIQDGQGRRIASIRRGWTLLVSRTEITDGSDNVIGYLKHKLRSRKPRLKIFNGEGKKIGEIAGTPGAWNMDIIDREYISFGAITQDHRGDASAIKGKDVYRVLLTREALEGLDRQVMLIAAIAIDRLLLENG